MKGRTMQISELSDRSGVPVARIKFYLREGMLVPGEATSATRATYGDEHLQRLRLIRSLTAVAGLPLSRVRKILGILDAPDESVEAMLGVAVAALSSDIDTGTGGPVDAETYPRAFAALEVLGAGYRPRMPAIEQLEHALAAVDEVGMPATPERLSVYGPHIRAIAEAEMAGVPWGDPPAAVEYSVLGTAMYEPVIAALRRLAHQSIATRES
jgi:DNA-binding transcriptional MerR regulator